MSKKTKFVIFAIVLFAAAVLFLVGIGEKASARRNGSKAAALLKENTSRQICLDDMFSFEWDRAYSFTPYQSVSSMEEELGFKSNALREADYDDIVNVAFVKGNKVVASIYGHSSDLGFSIDFDDFIANGEKTMFTKEGNVYSLISG
jgi:hypothetical protein